MKRRAITPVILVSVALGLPVRAGYHERGQLSASIAGSFSHTYTIDRKSDTDIDLVFDGQVFREVPREGEDYSDVDLSIFLSLGYFVIDHLELGISATAMQQQYFETDRDGFGVYDGQLYVRYFFDNPTTVTPYLRLKGGYSWIESGDYEERNTIAGGIGGVEIAGMGPLTWFIEYSTDYTWLGGSLSGGEWRNQIYVGMSVYLDVLRNKKEEVQELPLPATVSGEATQDSSVTVAEDIVPAPAPATTFDPLVGLGESTRELLRAMDAEFGPTLRRVDEQVKKKAQR